MALASYTDGNDWLDGTKLKFVNDDDASPEARSADRVILSILSPVFPEHAPLWVNGAVAPAEETPALVKLVAGMLMASYRYAKAYSEEADAENGYAARLAKNAMAKLEQVADGTLKLYDTDYEDEGDMSEDLFWPNNTTVVTEDESLDFAPFGLKVGDPLRSFTTEQTF